MGKKKRSNARASRQNDKLRKQQQRMQVQQTFQYMQVDSNWKNSHIQRLGIPAQSFRESDESTSAILLYKPTILRKICANGNCFFNALSYIITDSEMHNFLIRQKICEFMKTNSEDIKFLLPLECNEDIFSYLTSSKMENDGTWATEIEIMAASCLLETPVFVYSKNGTQWKWMRHAPTTVNHNKAIYLCHTNEDHYDAVVAVENSRKLDNIPDNECCAFPQSVNTYQNNPNSRKRKLSQCREYRNKRYKTDKSFADSKKLSDKVRYRTSPNYRQQKKIASKRRYWTLSKYRQQKKQLSHIKYSTNSVFRLQLKNMYKQKYLTNNEHRNRVKEYSVKKYSQDAAHRDKVKQSSIKKYSQDTVHRDRVKQSSIKKYSQDTVHRDKVKQSSIKKYSQDTVHRDKVKQSSIKKYSQDAVHRNKVKQSSIKKYSQDTTHRDKVKQSLIKKYSLDTAHRDKVKQRSVKKYSQDTAYRDKVKRRSVKKYLLDTTHRDKVKQSSVNKYLLDTAHRDKVKQSSWKKYLLDTAHRQKVKKYSTKKYSENAAHRDKVKQYSCTKYATNRLHRQKVLNYSKFKYQRFTTFRNHVKASSIKKYSSNPLFRAKLKKYLKENYHSNPSTQQLKKQRVLKSRKSVEKCVKKFRKNISNTPHFICIVCFRILYRKQVKECKRQRYFVDGQLNENAARCFSADNHNCEEQICTDECIYRTLKDEKEWICHTCDTHLRNRQVPPQAYINNLNLPPVPPVLKRLNVLERQLISLRIPFMKLLSLPRGGQKGMKGPVVNVPSDLNSITTSLPRNINDAQLIKVKLKRKLTYKGYYTYQWINPTNVLEALQYLKEHNSFYENITLDEQWIENIKTSELTQTNDNIESSDEEDNDEHNKDEVSKKDDNEVSENDFTIPVETCFQPIDIGQDILDANATLCIAPAENQNPQNIFQEEGSDLMAFPTLLPEGQFGLFEQREIKLTPSKYFNVRLFSADNRFATNKEYLFFAQYVTELNYISSNISLALRKGKATTDDGKNLTASMILNSNNISQILKSDSGYRFLQPVRGTPPYWQRTMKDIHAMIRQLGIPTWFVTFSAAEFRWEEVIETLLHFNNDDRKPEDIEWAEKCTLINDNPVLCARMFDHRVKALFSDLLMSPSNPIGQVIDFFYRTEFQQRGSPHIHCLLWVIDAPKLNENTDDEICRFIDSYVTCSLPDKEKNPELHDIITSVQMHSKSHSKSCKMYSSTCRFNFPRPPILKTFIARVDKEETLDMNNTEMPSEEQLNEMCKAASRTPKQILRDIWSLVSANDQNNFSFTKILQLVNVSYSQYIETLTTVATRNTIHLKRKLTDVWVNNYNPDLSLAWNANLDIQFVTDSYACVAYILSYISKAEMEMGDLLQNAQKEAGEGNLDAANAMRKIGHVYLQNRELSAQEAVYRVCGLHLKDCSREVVFIPAGSNIFKMSLPINLIKARSKQGDGDENIWMTSIYDKYYARPNTADFNDMSLAEFSSKYRILSQSQIPKTRNTQTLPVFELQKGLGFVKRRKPGKEAVIRFPRFNIAKNANEYYLTTLQLYLPHRDKIILPEIYVDFVEYVAHGLYNGKKISKIIEENQHHFEIDAENLDKAWQELQEGKVHEDMWASVAPETEAERLDTLMEKSVENMEESEQIPELAIHQNSSSSNSFSYQAPKISEKSIQEALRNMNEIQQSIFYKSRDWCLQRMWKRQPKPFHLFLTGGAGTGKSHLIHCIYHEATRILSKHSDSPDSITVLLTAPTGTAAFNIDGLTIHSAFSINKNIKLPYQPLTENSLNTLRSKLDNLQILVIDEISMVDHKILSYIHGRLCQIKHSKKPFGNICLIAVGDFYQLPPVRGMPLFKVTDANFSDLWNPYFKVATLTEVMRQKDDSSFAHMLNRLRTHTHGIPLLPTDLDALKTVSYDNTPSDKEDVLHIFATNKDVNKHNDTMIEKKCSPVYISLAKDFYRDIITGKMRQRENPYATCAAEDLQTTLKLGIGARVMLTRNLDTEDGLVNGAFGIVTSLKQDSSNQITAVYVEFDNKKIGHKHMSKTVNQSKTSVKIEMFEDSLRGKQVTRKQYPLKLGYAATIHKTQGMTVNQLVVSLKGIFQPGMAYVALSRATTLSGLHILNFNPDTIYSSSDITEALQQMQEFLPAEVPKPSTETLKIILHNTEGLLPHLSDIQNMKKFTEADIVCYTETWLTKNSTLLSNLFENYKYFLKCREKSYIPSKPVFKTLSDAERGGVAVFIRKTINHSELIFKTENIEAVGILMKKPLQICLLNVYRPPAYPLQLFKDQLLLLIEEIQQFDIPSIIVGDFNDNVLLNSSKLVEALSRHGYKQLVDKPTTQAGTSLDLVFVNRLSTEIEIKLLPTYYSFHDAIEINIPVEDM